MWCGVNRQRAERSRALGPVRPTSDATRAANAAQSTTRRRRQRRRPTHPRNTHERATPPVTGRPKIDDIATTGPRQKVAGMGFLWFLGAYFGRFYWELVL